jgi:hypothetical protein
MTCNTASSRTTSRFGKSEESLPVPTQNVRLLVGAQDVGGKNSVDTLHPER